MLPRNEIVRAARDMINMPYQHRGFNEYAVDCYGLCVHVAARCGLPPLPHLSYGPSFERDFFRENFYRLFETKGPHHRELGAVVALQQNTVPCHMGILTMKNGVWHMVHATPRSGKVVEEPFDKPYYYSRNIITSADFRT